MRNLLLAVCAMACLSACGVFGTTPPITVQPPIVVGTPTSTAPTSSPLAQLQAFTLADLEAASSDAGAQTPPDVTSKQCYDYLIELLPTLPSFAPGQTVGAILAFQKARDIANGFTNQQGVLKSLNLACAPLVIDTQTTLNKLGILAAGAATTGTAALPILQGLTAP